MGEGDRERMRMERRVGGRPLGEGGGWEGGTKESQRRSRVLAARGR